MGAQKQLNMVAIERIWQRRTSSTSALKHGQKVSTGPLEQVRARLARYLANSKLTHFMIKSKGKPERYSKFQFFSKIIMALTLMKNSKYLWVII